MCVGELDDLDNVIREEEAAAAAGAAAQATRHGAAGGVALVSLKRAQKVPFYAYVRMFPHDS